MGSVTVNGVALAYDDRGSGEPVLLLHPGFVADGMQPLLDAAELGGYRLLAYHRRGYGRSGPVTGPVALRQQAQDALSLLDALGVDRAHLVGHSFGADVALQAALDAPGRVGSLALLEPLLGFAMRPETAGYVLATAGRAVPEFLAGDAEAALDTWLTAAFGPGFRDRLERRLPGTWRQAVADAGTPFGVELAALQEWPVGPPDVARVSVPTLSVTHADDTWPGFRETHEFLLATVSDCDGAVLPLDSHLLQILEPEPVAAVLDAFLRRHPLAAS